MVICVQKISEEQLEQLDHFLLYIYTPFCGTCHLAKSFLDKIESTHQETIFYEMNASLYPSFMQNYEIESVPCLLIKDQNEIKEKVYTFHSVANMYHYIWQYAPYLFQK